MTAGTAVIMWLGELITDRGIGNGMSLLIFTSIASRFPPGRADPHATPAPSRSSSCSASAWSSSPAVVFVEQGQRRIPVQYAKRMIGRRMYGGTSTYIPLKVNQAGVIPVHLRVVAALPPAADRPVGGQHGPQVRFVVEKQPRHSDTGSTSSSTSLLIIFFTYFYVAITFNPVEVADNMKKYGGFIPGIRPGRPDRRVPQLRPVPDHPARRALPGHRRRPPASFLLGAHRRATTRTSRSVAPRC